MKLLIDIPEIAYEAFKEWHKNKVATVEQSIIANGTPLANITDEQISKAFQIAIANYWEEKSKHLTPPPTPCYNCTTQTRAQGEWIIVKDEKYGDNVKCPFCGKELAGTDLNFCCKCGAKMKGGAVNENN
jgi:hypothetical protein